MKERAAELRAIARLILRAAEHPTDGGHVEDRILVARAEELLRQADEIEQKEPPS